MTLADQMLALLSPESRAYVLESEESRAAKRAERIAAKRAAYLAEMEARYPHLRRAE